MFVKLTYDEIELAASYARQIDDNKKKRGVISKKQDKKRSDFEILHEGICCEMAVYKHLGIPYKVTLYRGGDKIDLMYKGFKCSIKKVGDGKLRIAKWQKDYDCDIYIGVEVISQESYRLVGAISKKRFNENCYIKTYNSDMWCVDIDLLKRFKNVQH